MYGANTKIFLINYRESADIGFKNLGHDRTSNENCDIKDPRSVQANS